VKKLSLYVTDILAMYRAIREVNRPCAMADRDRQYRLHQQTLQKIHGLKAGSPLDQRICASPSALVKRTNRPDQTDAVSDAGPLRAVSPTDQKPKGGREGIPMLDLTSKRKPTRRRPTNYTYGCENAVGAINAKRH
jgi:hypothetical protein